MSEMACIRFQEEAFVSKVNLIHKCLKAMHKRKRKDRSVSEILFTHVHCVEIHLCAVAELELVFLCILRYGLRLHLGTRPCNATKNIHKRFVQMTFQVNSREQ